MDKSKHDRLIEWCKEKLAKLKRQHLSDKYKQGYEDAMKAIMSKLHDEKEKLSNGN